MSIEKKPLTPSREWPLTEDEFKEFLLGGSIKTSVKIYMESNKDESDKEYFIESVLSSFDSIQKQKLSVYESLES